MDVDRVVTEYGIAELRGTNVRERVQRLTAIAHPDFREDIMREAQEMGIIGRKSF
jgi:acyl-CoA hydrolase